MKLEEIQTYFACFHLFWNCRRCFCRSPSSVRNAALIFWCFWAFAWSINPWGRRRPWPKTGHCSVTFLVFLPSLSSLSPGPYLKHSDNTLHPAPPDADLVPLVLTRHQDSLWSRVLGVKTGSHSTTKPEVKFRSWINSVSSWQLETNSSSLGCSHAFRDVPKHPAPPVIGCASSGYKTRVHTRVQLRLALRNPRGSSWDQTIVNVALVKT